MKMLVSLLCGLLFGCGLIISGMANPAKVLGFLDITRLWDPSLALVMAGAVVVGLTAFRLAARRGRPVLGGSMNLPVAVRPDWRLIAGALLFGTGWGLAAICPGPALILLASGVTKGALFVLAMLAGMGLYHWLARYLPA
ncbi:DUF6691 family protein [Erwinia mallotivora]|uniref:Membrane protein n=1 Tax=Erwinia mallotivora TaxID=69222 RepID=A0A014ME35_9GAMM|nr:DUF6691 family protein [Erwinia mallotivora]EXU76324.1 membrane protein [Erwinia mallotivora]